MGKAGKGITREAAVAAYEAEGSADKAGKMLGCRGLNVLTHLHRAGAKVRPAKSNAYRHVLRDGRLVRIRVAHDSGLHTEDLQRDTTRRQ